MPDRKLLVPSDERVGAGGYALDLELARGVRDGEERVLEHADVGAHPGVLVALDGDDRLGALELSDDGGRATSKR